METACRAAGYIVHALDPVAGTPAAPDLWKLTEEDAKAIAEPLARIANRYATLRGAASFSDEIGVAGALAPYVKRNLAERGRVKAVSEQLDRADPHASAYERSQPEPASPPETRAAEPTSQPGSQPENQPGSQPGSQPEPGQATQAGESEPDGLQTPKAGVAEAFEYALPADPFTQPPHLEPPAEPLE